MRKHSLSLYANLIFYLRGLAAVHDSRLRNEKTLNKFTYIKLFLAKYQNGGSIISPEPRIAVFFFWRRQDLNLHKLSNYYKNS